jgi:DNA repair exonuclease SbcCD nuclease subunit
MEKINSRGLFIGDPHFKDGAVPNRKDNYLDSISLKFQESLEIARDLGLDYVVILGDLFNVQDPPGLVRNKVVEILSRGNNGIKWPFDIFLVVGNHDIYARNIKTIDRTAIKTLESAGLLKICEFSEEYGIYFGHYREGIEKTKFDVKFPIIALHSYVVPTEYYDSILIKDFYINDTNKLVISGHYHYGYPIIERSPGVFFANPGSLGRVSSDDINHKIQVILVELKESEIEKIEYIPLKQAKQADLIFDIEAIKNRTSKRIDITDFVRSIESAKTIVSKDSNIVDIVKQFGKETKVDQLIVDEAIKRILSVGNKEIFNDEQ